MIRTWCITIAALISLLLSSYSAATMPVTMLMNSTLMSPQCSTSNMQHASHSMSSQQVSMHSMCDPSDVQADNTSHHHQKTMSTNCCDSTCVASYVYLPTPTAHLIEQHSLLLIEHYSPVFTSRLSSSLYRPPIA
ncbi:hypothetical protein [Vibrio rumoiensis]|uniref:DUF2946 domain-containing protein n=1 Tax=Vibrio rumoiensis 1S-45 TaxID=1188252 RepID=A0A1E5E1U2_9VIBR|nr:hypothetical protein [Vibrio rumoiensis]OEF24288.1 hypothetical protein A1QC_10385 [Vibrio rumoiensis 1S-45]